VLLVMAYGKGQKDTLTPDEKAGIKKYLAIVQNYLDTRD
jgi:hypothetical protein